MRFPVEDVSKLTMQQLRGREGARVRRIYRDQSIKHGVEWTGRDYNPDDFESGTPVNQALSAANVALYGVAHSVIVALGMSPGLGFIHTGHELSFVYDIADLYKAEISIPIAFQIASNVTEDEDIGRLARLKIRDYVLENKLMKKIVKDLQELLEVEVDDQLIADDLSLWDDKEKLVAYGISYHEGE